MSMTARRAFLALSAALALSAGSGCAWLGLGEDERVVIGGAEVSAESPVMAALRNSADHTLLVAALEAGDLATALEGPGPFTVLAPTNRAMETFAPDRLRESLGGEPDVLQVILKTHVVEALVSSETLANALPGMGGRTKLLSLNDQFLRVDGTPERLRVLDQRNRSAGLLVADGRASNGFVHVIDNVLLPPKDELRPEAENDDEAATPAN